MNASEQIKRDEGLRLKPYADSVGKISIGWGRNLSDKGITKDEAEYLFANDLSEARIVVAQQLPWSTDLDEARQAVLINMAFNMGINRLLSFHNTLALIKAGSYAHAAEEMRKSKWAAQVGERAERLARQMRSGKFE